MGQSSSLFGVALLSVTPRLSIYPNTGTVGSTAVAQGVGFGPGEMVQVYWTTPRRLLSTAMEDNQGSFSESSGLTFTIPVGAPSGTNIVYGYGLSTQAVGKAEVTVH